MSAALMTGPFLKGWAEGGRTAGLALGVPGSEPGKTDMLLENLPTFYEGLTFLRTQAHRRSSTMVK